MNEEIDIYTTKISLFNKAFPWNLRFKQFFIRSVIIYTVLSIRNNQNDSNLLVDAIECDLSSFVAVAVCGFYYCCKIIQL